MIRKARKQSSVANTNVKVPIRVLYKKVGKAPEVKIVDIYKLKKFIVKNKLDIVPYEKLFIICHNKSNSLDMLPNIYLPLRGISGSFIVVDIDRKKREFKSLLQEDIIPYTQDLINKSAQTKNNLISEKYINNFNDNYERGFEENRFSKPNNFEKTLITVLINLELVLTSILKKNGDDKNDKKRIRKKNTGT